jgi:hypothetical protein
MAKQRMRKNIGFINLTELEEDEAQKTVHELIELVQKGENYQSERLKKATRAMEVWKGDLWCVEDKEFFESFDMTPYEFRIHRPILNTLITRQRSRKFKFSVVPMDPMSYRRYREGLEEFLQKHGAEYETISEAEKAYLHYADDEYANVLTGIVHNARWNSRASRKESEVFEEGIITGMSFLKANFGRKYEVDGGIEIEKIAQRAIIYDEASVDYDMDDIEFIGQIHRIYASELIVMFPDAKEQIMELFSEYTNLDSSDYQIANREYGSFYTFDDGNREVERLQVKIVEMWYRDIEERIMVEDTQTGEIRMVKFGMSPEEVLENLRIIVLEEMVEQAGDVDSADFLEDPNVQDMVDSMVQERFQLRDSQEFIWRQAIFTRHGLFKFERSSLPHGKHPFSRFVPQFTDGFSTSIMDDIIDVIVSINKALAIRELMMAHGAKNLVIVDMKTLEESGYEINDFAEHYATIGGVFALKLKPGKRLSDVVLPISTIGQGLEAINSILADYDNRLYAISGVNLAQLGYSQGETPATRYSQQLSQGEENNGLIFDNFFNSLEHAYTKVITMAAEIAKLKKGQVIRLLGDTVAPWIEIPDNEDFDLFVDNSRNGKTALVVTPIKDNPQMDTMMSAKLFELARVGLVPIDVAFQYSNFPDKHKIIKDIRSSRSEQNRRMAMDQVDIQQVQQMMVELGLAPEAVEEALTKMRKQAYQQFMQSQQQPSGGGMPTISREAGQMTSQANLEQTLQ